MLSFQFESISFLLNNCFAIIAFNDKIAIQIKKYQ